MYWEQMTYPEWIISCLPFYCDCHDACVLREWENVMWQLDGKHWLMDNINRQIKWPPTQITASASVRDKLNKLCYPSSFLLQYSLRPISVLTLKIDFQLAGWKWKMGLKKDHKSDWRMWGANGFQFNLWAIKTSLARARLGEIEYLLMSWRGNV